MKENKEIIKRLAQLEDELLFTKAEKYNNFYKGSDLTGEEIRGAYLALSWVLNDEV